MTRPSTGCPATGRRPSVAALAAVGMVALAALSGCSQVDRSAAAEGPVSIVLTVPAMSVAVPPTTPTTTAEPPTTSTTTTTAPATTEPATTEAPAATEPATTVPRSTTTTIPANVEPVAAGPVDLVAVGGASGKATVPIQQRLLQLGFWLSAPNGNYDLTTKQAVMAFQKYTGIPASGKVDKQTATALQTVTERPHGTADQGDLVEIDKDKQLIFFVRAGRTLWTFNASTGSGKAYSEPDKNHPGQMQAGVAVTVVGLWKVILERPDGWWPGDLGQIYRPKYFHGGEAIHGSNNIPNYPASHGCVRVSVPAMDFIWAQDLLPLKSPVWVHGG